MVDAEEQTIRGHSLFCPLCSLQCTEVRYLFSAFGRLPICPAYRVVQKVNHYQIIISIALKPANGARFSIKFEYKITLEWHKSILNILLLT